MIDEKYQKEINLKQKFNGDLAEFRKWPIKQII